MNRIIGALAIGAVVSVVSSSVGAVEFIDFEDFGYTEIVMGVPATQTLLADQYLSQGIVFEGNSFASNGWGSAIIGRSGYTVATSIAAFRFVTPGDDSSAATTDFISFENMAKSPSGSYAGYEIFIYDADGNKLGTYDAGGNPIGDQFVDDVPATFPRDAFTSTFTYEGMHRFEFVWFGNGAVPIDDMSFNEVTPVPADEDNGSAIPAPALSALMAVGALATRWGRR